MPAIFSDKFEKAVDYVIRNEGGYVFDEDDEGNETNYGISSRSYPNLDIKHLTLKDAKKIYFCDFWHKGRFEEIDDYAVATQVFDLSVNMGIRAAIIVLQRALRSVGINVVEDGLIGSQTLSAVKKSDPRCLLAAIKSEAAGYYRMIVCSKPGQTKFLNGWLNRAYKPIN